MKIISLFFVMVALFVNPAISKDYEYKQYLQDNNIKPLIKSSEENSVDIIEFSSFSCSHCAAFHNETLQELKESDVYKADNVFRSSSSIIKSAPVVIKNDKDGNILLSTFTGQIYLLDLKTLNLKY